MTGAELAQRAGISPSYVSLIEKGAKVPDEDVAASLALALDDDEGLYRAWARAARLGLHDLDLLYRLETIARTPAYMSLVESGEALPELAPRDASSTEGNQGSELVDRMREVASRVGPSPAAAGPEVRSEGEWGSRHERQTAFSLASDVSAEPAFIRVPVLSERADPDQLETLSSAAQDHLLLDRRLVDEEEPDALFAYSVTPRAMKHLRGVAAPGDQIVLRRTGRVAPDRICAVRTGQGVVLARILFKDRSVLLLPGEGERDFEAVEVPGPEALSDVIAGTHVLLIRR
jgi:transcriptional regulator with XRE-family HTH domain